MLKQRKVKVRVGVSVHTCTIECWFYGFLPKPSLKYALCPLTELFSSGYFLDYQHYLIYIHSRTDKETLFVPDSFRFGEFAVTVVRDMIIPNCSWRAGRVAASIRTSAVSCLWAMFQSNVLTQKRVITFCIWTPTMCAASCNWVFYIW